MKKISGTYSSLLGALVTTAVLIVTPALAQDHSHATTMTPERQSWTFAGPFGYYDRAQLQRGFKVFREVCSNCHSMSKVSFRNLAQPGGPEFSAGQIEALAAEYKVKDGPNDAGEMFQRPGRPSDRIPWNFANEQEARAALGGALPPDMSVLAKARTYPRGFPMFLIDAFQQYQEHGPDYIVSLLNNYAEPPEGMVMAAGQNYNMVMPGNKIAMAAPLADDQVDYTDGSPKTKLQYSRDVAAFLMWAAEPKLEERKKIGFRVMIFLVLFAGLLYYSKKKIWAGLHEEAHA